jgi:hypothetical protein
VKFFYKVIGQPANKILHHHFCNQTQQKEVSAFPQILLSDVEVYKDGDQSHGRVINPQGALLDNNTHPHIVPL